MGLETAHPVALERLNKRFTLERFREPPRALAERGMSLRVFLLIYPPFIPAFEQDAVAPALGRCRVFLRCISGLADSDRSGNGTMNVLADTGSFAAPGLSDIERSAALAISHAQGRGRVFVDLWDLERLRDVRRASLHVASVCIA